VANVQLNSVDDFLVEVFVPDAGLLTVRYYQGFMHIKSDPEATPPAWAPLH
jgi:hypothetical protein